MAFVHLHTHTEYSLLDGSNKVKAYVERVKELGMNAAAITDHGVMYGVIDFYKAAKAAGIKPIIGCEVYVAPGSRFDREVGESADRYYHLILLAENNTGYQNLSKIVSRSFTEGYYYKPRVDKELLKEFHEGIICCSACLAGEVARCLARGDYEGAKSAALSYRDIFGEENFFLELQDHGPDYPEQQGVNAGLLRLHQDLGIPLVATNDCHYTREEDAEAHDILLCIQTGKKLTDEGRMRYPGGQFYVKSEEEMRELFRYAPEALENTQKIADRCDVTIEFGVTKLPHYEVPEGYDSWTYLNHLCDEGFRKNYPGDDGTVRERLDYELSVIKRMGYVDYFLIVWDYINFCRENGIAVGPGRGSAAGSVVSYCMGITQLDPIRYQLLFERFLNPERVSMPDIDVDFEFERRGEVIDYVTRKYGKERVVQIITFGTLQAKGVVRDVGRVMDLPYAFCDGISKKIPQELGMTLAKALEMNPELKRDYDNDPKVKSVIDMGMKLEGLPRHSSIHAAGVVICSIPAEDLIPLSRGADGSVTTQFTMTLVEELGLLKMDFLGLRTLSVIQNATRMANRKRQEQGLAPIDIDRIDYDDKAVFESLSTGHCDGVFQLESGGMESFMKDLRPQSLEDVIAGIALYRPGPMDFIPQYERGKNGGQEITYITPQLEPILAPTYGCIVYQEQVMQIVRDLGGYSLGRADLVRRAMSKKKADVMAKERQNFVYGNPEEGVPGCIANGISEAAANQIYDTMTDFAKYAFNKSHAACYAVVTYQTAWLKYYYPLEFFAALMTSVIDAPTKVTGYFATCRELKITILPPDINKGEADFSVSDGAIRYALTAVKGVGRPLIDGIVRERRANGPFRDLGDFLERMNGSLLNKRAVECFIKAGALDCFGATRKQMMNVYLKVMDDLQASSKNNIPGQLSFFDFLEEDDRAQFMIQYPDVGEFDKDLLLAFEKEVLGIYMSGHPLERYASKIRAFASAQTTDFYLDEETNEVKLPDGRPVKVGGMVSGFTTRFTKQNRPWGSFFLEDLSGTVECRLWPDSYERFAQLLQDDARVLVEGRVSHNEGRNAMLMVESARPLDELPGRVWLRFPDLEHYRARAGELKDFIDSHGGRDHVVLYIEKERLKKELREGSGIRADEENTAALAALFGAENVKVL